MHWLETHQALVAAIAVVTLVVFALILLIALTKVLRQGRRAMFGAHPVIGPPAFGTSTDGGLVLIVPFANAAAAPAYRFSARVKADRAQAGAPPGTVTLFGYGSDPEANRVRIAFDWPVGILDADVTVTWNWQDAAGTFDGAWHGHLRVPEPELPDELELDQPADGVPRRTDPLSTITGGTAKASVRRDADS